MSRTRIPLSALKQIAEQLIDGANQPPRTRHSRPKSKVAALRDLMATDKEIARKVTELYKALRLEEAHKALTDAGLALKDAAHPADRLLAAIEAAEKDGTLPRQPMPPADHGPRKQMYAWDDPGYRAAQDRWEIDHCRPFLEKNFSPEDIAAYDQRGRELSELFGE